MDDAEACIRSKNEVKDDESWHRIYAGTKRNETKENKGVGPDELERPTTLRKLDILLPLSPKPVKSYQIND